MLSTATSADDNTAGSLAIPTAIPEAGDEGVSPDAGIGIPEPEIRPDEKPGQPRPKRDYNYFADLRAALAELQNAKECSLTTDDDIG
jgi:hypothetical protein